MRLSSRRTLGALIGVAVAITAVAVVTPAVTDPASALTATCPGGSAPPDRFTDDDGNVHEAAIACTTAWELTRGVSATTYAPGRSITRGQAATLVARLLTRTGSTLPASPPDRFPDDTGGAHSYATNRLAALGIVGGRTDGRFAPAAGVSRGAIASLLVAAYSERTGIDPPAGGDHFTDDDGTVHEHAIDQAAELGLTLGSAPGLFDPWSLVSRAQAASFLARTLTAVDALGSAGTPPAQLHATSTLQPVADCEPLLGTIKERALESVGPYGLADYVLPLGSDSPGGGVPLPGTGGDSEGAGGGTPPPDPGSSGTNNQEPGVDEADIVKVDGTRVVTIVGGVLRVIDAAGGTPVVQGSLDLGEDADHRLLVHGDQVLVLSTTWGGGGLLPGVEEPTTSDAYAPWKPLTTLRLIDVTTPTTPIITSAARVDGSVLGARLIDGVARVVVRTEPTIVLVGPAEGSTEALAAATTRNRELIETSTLADWVPQVQAGASGAGAAQPLLGCDDVSAPPEFAGLGFSSVLTIGLSGPLTDPAAVGVLAGSDLMYASPTTLYLASTRWETWQPSIAADQTRTDLHAFDIRSAAGATFLGSGRVVGHLLNQFSLSEHDGVLRVASTTDPAWWETSAPPGESRVTTLRLSGGQLGQVGLVTGLGVDERIFGVRFLGDLGYVITFRQIDPLHVLDLSDPAHPLVTGELQMPGYSAYLHPVGDGLLLGVGAAADPDGRRTGAQVSLFDVSDPSAPRRVSSVTLPGAWTDVEYDHLTFLWWPAAQRAVIPLTQYQIDPNTGSTTSEFSGAVGFAVDPVNGVDEVGRTSHTDDAGGGDARWPGIVRSLVVDGRLLTLSQLGIEVANLDDLSEEAWLPFAP